ncbi:MAG: cyclic nucleotide-binding domain-containing protein [Rhodoferax sp.]|nr:cyclic nucleotide-binding domain-containing protein [Rhodoferax sp.]MCF8208828.1 cyclic nucleotide-binding domain-containing protein [Rhodoferax sp.]
MTHRANIYRLSNPANQDKVGRRMRAFEVLVNLIGIVSVSVGTLHDLSGESRALAATITGVVAALFLIEYLIRLWVAPENPHFSASTSAQTRIAWAFSPTGIIDLLAVIPALAVASGEARLGADSASVFVLLWVSKLATRASGVALIARVFHNERSALGAAAALFAMVLFSSATVAHWLEAEAQPQFFGSIPSSLWWAVVTLTTTGYGDVVPQTPAGRMLGGLVMLCGICVLALLAGILATGFAEEVRRREFMRIWDLVAQVPFFSDVGAIAVADIVGQLHSRSFSAGTRIIHKGEAGDSMYFIVSGSVQVHLGERTKILRDGDFFGEMALLERKPRSADVVTLTQCTTLVLEVADFYRLAGQQPDLIAAIETEAKRRRALNAAPQLQ